MSLTIIIILYFKNFEKNIVLEKSLNILLVFLFSFWGAIANCKTVSPVKLVAKHLSKRKVDECLNVCIIRQQPGEKNISLLLSNVNKHYKHYSGEHATTMRSLKWRSKQPKEELKRITRIQARWRWWVRP